MIDLKKIISQLDYAVYERLEGAMVKSKAENSLFLLRTYRKDNISDPEIINHLGINPSSLYTLKSRLYDKIQDQLTSNQACDEESLLDQVNQIHKICYNNSKEIAVAFLTKLEVNLLKKDMHGELLIVYSALKQLHLFSDKYFYYAQLYNKQIAFSLTIEKSAEILGNFNRILTQYDFSRLESDLETLQFLYNGIQEQYSLNSSKQIELIRNIIEIQLYLYCGQRSSNPVIDPLTLLKRSTTIILELPPNTEQKQWMPALDFLYFEYYNLMNDLKNAEHYYESVNNSNYSLPFYSNICIVSKFLVSKVIFLQKTGRIHSSDLSVFNTEVIDSKNMHSIVLTDMYNALVYYYNGKIKEAIGVLNSLLNNISLKDLHFINIEIKLTLAYFYIKRKEYDLAEMVLKSASRKIKTDKLQSFTYVNNLIKLMLLEIGAKTKQTAAQQSDLLTLFLSKNKNIGLFDHLNYELSNQYSA